MTFYCIPDVARLNVGGDQSFYYDSSFENTHAFYEQHFYKHRQAETDKNQANTKQHPEAELLGL